MSYLELSINHKNVLDALKNANRLNLQFIKEFCLRYIIKESSYNDIVMSKVKFFENKYLNAILFSILDV